MDTSKFQDDFVKGVRAAKRERKPLSIFPGDSERVGIDSLPALNSAEAFRGGVLMLRVFIVSTDAELRKEVVIGRRYALLTGPSLTGEYQVGEYA